MKYFTINNNTTLEDLKKEYKKLATKLHPDNGGDTKAFQEMQEEFTTLFNSIKKGNFDTSDVQGHKETPEEYINIINQLVTLEGLDIELCGTWIWISGNTYTHKDTLKSIGCKFASKKKMWYYRSEEHATHSRKQMSMYDIRAKYGSVALKGDPIKRLATA